MEKRTLGMVAKVVSGANRSEIHRATGITLGHVSRVLSGKRVASAGTLKLVAEALNLTMDELHTYLVTLQSKTRKRRRLRSVA